MLPLRLLAAVATDAGGVGITPLVRRVGLGVTDAQDEWVACGGILTLNIKAGVKTGRRLKYFEGKWLWCVMTMGDSSLLADIKSVLLEIAKKSGLFRSCALCLRLGRDRDLVLR